MIKYPNGKTNSISKVVPEKKYTGGRGMELEKEINLTNSYYLSHDIAVIHKKPTPVTIVKVDYPKRSSAKITEAYFKLPSTTDYNGIYKGKYIDFEAKDCQSLTSFPLKNSIHLHQIKHLDAVLRHGAIAFIIIRFVKKNQTFYCPANKVIDFYEHADRSSIPYSWFKENAYEIPANYIKPVDYISIINKLFFEKENAQ